MTARLRRIRFARHGATAPNLAGLACGGDLDVPLAALGRRHAEEVGRQARELAPPPGIIVTSDLMRTRETAAIAARMLGGIGVHVEPALNERRLGEWNLRPTDKTRPWLASGLPPPGGETEEAFVGRIADGLRAIWHLLPQRPLVISSRGVGRAIGVLLELPQRVDLDNGAMVEFDLAHFDARVTEWDDL